MEDEIIIYTNSKEERELYTRLAKRLNNKYEVKDRPNRRIHLMKEFKGLLSKEEGKSLLQYVDQSRNEWDARNT